MNINSNLPNFGLQQQPSPVKPKVTKEAADQSQQIVTNYLGLNKTVPKGNHST